MVDASQLELYAVAEGHGEGNLLTDQRLANHLEMTGHLVELDE